MVTSDVQNLKHSYSLLDYIAKVVHDVELEQLAQAAQMRRIEQELHKITIDLSNLKADVDKRMEAIDKRMEAIEKALTLITKHLGIS